MAIDTKLDARPVALEAALRMLRAGASAVGEFDPLLLAAALVDWIDEAGPDTKTRHARLEAVRLVGRHRAAAALCSAPAFIRAAEPLVRFLLDGPPPRSRKPGLPEAA